MAKVTTTYTSSMRIPVAANFTCPHCQKNVVANANVFIASSASGRGYVNTAAKEQAQRNLMNSAGSQIDFIAEQLGKGDLSRLANDSGSRFIKLKCPECGVRQLPIVRGKKKTLYPKHFALKMIGLFLLIATVFGVLIGVISAVAHIEMQKIGTILPFAELATIVVIILAIIKNRKLSKKAYSDPELMASRYKTAINNKMDFVLFVSGAVRTVSMDLTEGGK